MKQKLTNELKHELTGKLIELLKILQIPRLELEHLIRQEIEINPFLEEIEINDDEDNENDEDEEQDLNENELDYDYFNHEDSYMGRDYSKKAKEDEVNAVDICPKPDTFREHMLRQIHISFDNVFEMAVGEYITDSLSDDGLIEIESSEIEKVFNIDEDACEKILKKYRSLNPIGVGSRSIRESLLTQLDYMNRTDTLEYKIINEMYDDLINNRIYKILAKLNINEKRLKQAIDEISKLNPKPANGEWGETNNYIVPDVIIEKRDDDFVPVINSYNFPSLHLNKKYLDILKSRKGLDKKEKQYLKKKLNDAILWINGINKRNITLLNISERIVMLQKDFFIFGVSALKPMSLINISDYIGMHESTVSRALENKYFECPNGIYSFKFLFSSSVKTVDGEISSTNVKDLILRIIKNENKSKPLKDNEIQEILKKEHQIDIARRTIGKYRDQLGIPAISKRKKYFKEER